MYILAVLVSTPTFNEACARGCQKGFPKSDYFSNIGFSSVKTIAHKHKHVVYHNKQWWGGF